jgi:two-component system OmpR family response regulator
MLGEAMTDTRRLRVLLVDDEPDMLALLQAVVTAESWEVVGRATNAADAMRVAEHIQPDAAIVDYRMPGENGLQLAARIKAMWPQTVVVMFSAMDVEAEALASGSVDRFVRKGDLRYLREALDQLNEQLGRRGDS